LISRLPSIFLGYRVHLVSSNTFEDMLKIYNVFLYDYDLLRNIIFVKRQSKKREIKIQEPTKNFIHFKFHTLHSL